MEFQGSGGDVINQESRLQALTRIIFEQENQISILREQNLTYTKPIIDENERLRLQIDGLNAEIVALSHENTLIDKNMQQLMLQCAKLEEEALHREQNFQDTKVKEYEEENTRLRNMIEQQKGSIESLSLQLSEKQSQIEAGKRVNPDVSGEGSVLMQLGSKSSELKVAKTCLVQLESEFQEVNTLSQFQRDEIKRLNLIIEALNKEKSLIPPVILTIPQFKEKAEFVTSEVHAPISTKRKGDESDEMMTVQAPDYKDRSSIASAQQKALREQRELLTRVLKALENVANRQIHLKNEELRMWEAGKGVYYKGSILHAISDTATKPAGYRKRLLACALSNLYVYDDTKDENPIALLKAHKVQNSAVEPEGLHITLHYQATEGSNPEVHHFQFKDEDDFDRWFHAFRYAGFIKTERVEPKSQVKKSKKLLVDVFIPNMKNPDGSFTAPEQRGCELEFDKEANSVQFLSENVLNPAKISCSLCQYKAKPELNEIVVLNPFGKMRVRTENKEAFSLVLSMFQQANWKQIPEESISHLSRVKVTPEESLASVKEEKKVFPEVEAEKEKSVSSESSSSETLSEETVDNMQEMFFVKDGELMIYEKKEDTIPAVALKAENCCMKTNKDAFEIEIVHKPGTSNEESYVFLLPNEATFLSWSNELQANNFTERKIEGPAKKTNQVGVVTTGVLELYRYYGSPDSQPIITLPASTCSAIANRERREISIANSAGKMERITLDCSSINEFERWYVALTFGGFIEPDTEGKKGFGNLAKYVFPINMFDDADETGKSSALEIQENFILLYPSKDAKKEILKIGKSDCEVQFFTEMRKIRIYAERHTDSEQRLDLTFLLAKEFDRIKRSIEARKFRNVDPKQKVIPNLKPKGYIAVYRDKYQKTPECVIDLKYYTCETDDESLSISFFPTPEAAENSPKLPVRTFKCNTKEAYSKWDFTLKVANFKPFSEDIPSKYFFPYMNYGQTSIEVSELLKKNRRASGIDFFKFSSSMNVKKHGLGSDDTSNG